MQIYYLYEYFILRTRIMLNSKKIKEKHFFISKFYHKNYFNDNI